MRFTGFTDSDFETFQIEGLEERMEAIEDRIRPKFRTIGQELTDELSARLGSEMFLHIAKHARRTVNPPQDTWLAIAANKRGYKKHPHFQVGLFDDFVFVWLAFIYELPNKQEMAQTLLEHIGVLKQEIPKGFVISTDHMKKEAMPMGEIDLEETLKRFRDVKKAEFLVGKHILKGDPLLKDGDRFIEMVKKTFETLVPIYKLAYK
ncbi:YktB family protein [Siminovitchia sp. 179-K 8D1 HS]|uniref:YktB family protein n=1 Tax=Siminovitchia sp. 179-K 8D1 HS TaxID=3142385 RepID=UPI0039A0549B